MEQTGSSRIAADQDTVGILGEVLQPEELTGMARRLLERGHGPLALALLQIAEERMAWLSREAESLRRRE